MDTHVRTPQEIFLQPQHLVVPPFQRPYVWDEEEQWAPLWQDVRRLAEAKLDSPFANPTHFLGAVVVQAQEPTPGHLQASNIIDGQQRLTTLQLLMDATAGILEEAEADSLAGQLDVLTHNQLMYVTGGGTRLKVRHTNRDQAAFDEVMNADPPIDHAGLQHAGSLIARAHNYFSIVVGEWLGGFDAAEFAARADALVQVLARNLQLVAISLRVNENSQEIFETLNARGTPLTAADLIKNFVFQRLESEGVDTKRAYSEDWPFDAKFWEREVSVGRYRISRSSLFFNQWLVSRVGEEISPKATFARFKHYVEQSSRQKVGELLPILKRQAELYQEWTADSEEADRQLTRVEMAVYRMNASGIELLKPILIWLHEPGREVPSAVVEEVIDATESWVVRRQLLRLTGSDLGRIVAEIIKEYSDTPVSEVSRMVFSHLSHLNVSSTYWPGDPEIRNNLKTEQLYRRLRRGRLRMLLEAVENHYRFDTNQPQVPRRGYPIEHILPQKWADHWPVAGPEAEAERASHVHRLGNLTLLTKSLNSRVSNGAWLGKRKAIQEHDTLLLNSRLIASIQGSGWDEDSIDERTEQLTDVLLRVWPVPPGHVGEVIDPHQKAQGWIQIKDLVGANLLAPGSVLTPRQGQWEAHTATVTADGLLEVDGKVFESPSGAGKHVKGGATNGWYFWRLSDGRRLVDVRAAFTGVQPTRLTDTFDWSALHAILEALPEGSWTTYGGLADAIGTSGQAIGNHIPTCQQCANPHRVLRSGGTVSSDFAWSDPDDTRDPMDLLMGEGVSFTDSKADPTRELSADDLAALIAEDG